MSMFFVSCLNESYRENIAGVSGKCKGRLRDPLHCKFYFKNYMAFLIYHILALSID